MNDRELLELAAKAAGIEVWGASPLGENYGLRIAGLEPANWNPLADDGDALRLAVVLKLEVSVHRNSTFCDLTHDSGAAFTKEINGSDAFAATRRAIVRAAAEIGKDMP